MTTKLRTELRRILTPADLLLMLLTILFLVGWVASHRGSAGEQLVVHVDGRTYGTFDLHVPKRLEVRGPIGISVVEITAGGASILSAPCPRRICIRSGRLTQTGDVAACLPNQLVIRVAGIASFRQLDAVSK